MSDSGRNRKRKKKKAPLVIFVIEIIALVVLAAGIFLFARLNAGLGGIGSAGTAGTVTTGGGTVTGGASAAATPDPNFDADAAEENSEVASSEKLKGYTNIALVGIDTRDSKEIDYANSDTMIIASINNATGKIRMVSLYRDTLLNIGKNLTYNVKQGDSDDLGDIVDDGGDGGDYDNGGDTGGDVVDDGGDGGDDGGDDGGNYDDGGDDDNGGGSSSDYDNGGDDDNGGGSGYVDNGGRSSSYYDNGGTSSSYYDSGDDENDGGRYPDVLTSFADVITDKSGTIEKMNDGDGFSYSVSNASGGYKKDTLYRVVAQYRLVDESSIYLYNTTKTISPVPVPSNHIKGGFKTDSVRMQGIWLSAGYINIVLQIEGAGEAHSFHFGQDSISVSGEHRLVSLRLYHNRGEDAEYYTHRAYLSVPLKQYQLADGDTISMGVNLYGEGMKYYKFAYNQ